LFDNGVNWIESAAFYKCQPLLCSQHHRLSYPSSMGTWISYRVFSSWKRWRISCWSSED